MRLRTARHLVAFAVLVGLAAPAGAVPVQWSVDHASSALAITVQLQNPFIGTRSGSGASAASGVVDSELVDPDGLPSLELLASGIALDDTSFPIVLGGLFGTVTVTYESVGGTLTSAPLLGAASGPGTWSMDMTGALLSLDTGLVHATHPMLSQTVDLAATPTVFTFGSTLATYAATPSSGNQLDLSLTMPIDLWSTLAPIPAPIIGNVNSTLHMTGTLRMTATTALPAVPEPGTALLVSSGIAGLVVRGRKRRRGLR
jgi:hypothetical protein